MVLASMTCLIRTRFLRSAGIGINREDYMVMSMNSLELETLPTPGVMSGYSFFAEMVMDSRLPQKTTKLELVK